MTRVTAVVCIPVNAFLGQVAGNNLCQVLQNQLQQATQITAASADMGFWLTEVSFRTAEKGTSLCVEEMESKCTKLTLVKMK